ncbi:MAG: sulfurtransferase complex subunit TusB [Pseudomonadota bacterium]|nr:sulfurtransferase complex subunit TusB [Pseudomonadota bacterium]
MSTLHTINKSPFDRNSLDSCLRVISDGDAILLIEDGVYAATGTSFSDTVKAAAQSHSVYVLGPDLSARGMKEDGIVEGVKVVDYEGFVDLVTEHDKINSWL